MHRFRFIFLVVSLAGFLRAAPAAPPEPLLLAHYMPWYATKDVSGQWGWHWTMGHFDPDRWKCEGQREIASHTYPLIGPYDSGDPHALETPVLLMKFAGIDGVIVEWYGTKDFNDYAANHRQPRNIFMHTHSPTILRTLLLTVVSILIALPAEASG